MNKCYQVDYFLMIILAGDAVLPASSLAVIVNLCEPFSIAPVTDVGNVSVQSTAVPSVFALAFVPVIEIAGVLASVYVICLLFVSSRMEILSNLFESHAFPVNTRFPLFIYPLTAFLQCDAL